MTGTWSCKMDLRKFAVFTALMLTISSVAHAFPSLPDDEDTEEQAARYETAPNPDHTFDSYKLIEPTVTSATKAAVLAKYSKLDPQHVVNRDMLAKALLYLDANPALFPNKNYISIVNFSIVSRHVRFFNVNMKDGSVWSVHVAHGSQSDSNGDGIPDRFSNVDGSNMSSLGVFRTGEVYNSTKFKNAMRIDGLQSTNSNARSRAVVVHSAWYVWDSDLIAPGKTYGCFGLSEDTAPKVIDNIKNGSLLMSAIVGN